MKKFILGVIIGGIIFGTTGILAANYLYKASDIEYTPADSKWNVENVESAISDLYEQLDNIMPESLVPTMTSNTTPSGEAIASSYHYDTYLGSQNYHAFDNNVTTGWHANTDTTGQAGQWVGYHFTSPVKVKLVEIAPFWLTNEGNSRLDKYKIQASNDGVNWIDVTDELTYSGQYQAGTYGGYGTYQISVLTKNVDYYSYYRLYAVTKPPTNVDRCTAINDIKFYKYI